MNQVDGQTVDVRSGALKLGLEDRQTAEAAKAMSNTEYRPATSNEKKTALRKMECATKGSIGLTGTYELYEWRVTKRSNKKTLC